jgi:phosphoribosylformylglycinamidine synthase I
MAKNVRTIVLRTAGTNCDQETGFAFKSAGAQVDFVHINELVHRKNDLNRYHILAVPGGFSYGDDIESGRILANEMCAYLGPSLIEFINSGKLIIGICNGFQILVKAGILPGPLDEREKLANDSSQKTTLTNNRSGKFEDRWVHLKVNPKSVWTKGMKDTVYLPVAHAEGNFIPRDHNVLTRLDHNGQIAFRYCSPSGSRPHYPQNPNGSIEDIAGITDMTGRVLGLMPHPERHLLFTHHPYWTRLDKRSEYGDGAKLFENGVQFARESL